MQFRAIVMTMIFGMISPAIKLRGETSCSATMAHAIIAAPISPLVLALIVVPVLLTYV